MHYNNLFAFQKFVPRTLQASLISNCAIIHIIYIHMPNDFLQMCHYIYMKIAIDFFFFYYRSKKESQREKVKYKTHTFITHVHVYIYVAYL